MRDQTEISHTSRSIVRRVTLTVILVKPLMIIKLTVDDIFKSQITAF